MHWHQLELPTSLQESIVDTAVTLQLADYFFSHSFIARDGKLPGLKKEPSTLQSA